MTNISNLNAPRQLVLSGAIKAIESCVFPWVVTIDYRFERLSGADFEPVTERLIAIQQAPLSRRPEVDDLLPIGAEFLREDVFPATRFDRMPLDVRDRYTSHYRAYLMWRQSAAAGKGIDDLLAGIDYDPLVIASRVARWVSSGFTEGDE